PDFQRFVYNFALRHRNGEYFDHFKVISISDAIQCVDILPFSKKMIDFTYITKLRRVGSTDPGHATRANWNGIC
ncbi:MAG TPA: hypothetical protein VEZ26_09065, partial [Sphingomonadaceae bacterium]|nr:hypothetical protein [Sphingomonadaceae bacterium]